MTSFADAPGYGISTFAMVTLICGSSSRGVASTANNPSSTATSASSGVICECKKCLAIRPEIPIPIFPDDIEPPSNQDRDLQRLPAAMLLQLLNTQHLEDAALVKWLGSAFLHLADEVFLERNLGEVHPFAFREPVHVARGDLRYGHERHAAFAEVGQAHGIPGSFLIRGFTREIGMDIVHDGGHHG